MKSKKQFGMYTIILNDDDSLQIQAPTLIRPLSIEAKQVQDLNGWLNELLRERSQQPSIIPIPNAPLTPHPPVAPVVNTTHATETPVPATTTNESPAEIAKRVVLETIDSVQMQNPGTLAPENRDRFVEQLTRNPTIRPFMSQGKVTYKQILLWVEERLGTTL